MNAHIVKLFSPSGSGMTLVFSALPTLQNSIEGVKYTGWEKFAICDPNRPLSWKQYEIGPWLLFITNRKSLVADQSVSVPVTLRDLGCKGSNFSGGSP